MFMEIPLLSFSSCHSRIEIATVSHQGDSPVANTDDKVYTAVEGALQKNPSASVDELFDIARGVSPAVGKLTKRQFHARYPLQVKRRMSPKKPRRKTRAKAASRGGRRAHSSNGSARESVRATFMRFASDLAAAEARKDVVKVVAGVDRYVDEVLKATSAA
jgi:hypothetical protein